MSDMRVNTDPRIMKELLLSQIMSGIDPFSQSVKSAQQDGSGDSLFAQLLSQLTQPSLDSMDSSDGMDSLDSLASLSGLGSLDSLNSTDGSDSLLGMGLGLNASGAGGSSLSALGLNDISGALLGSSGSSLDSLASGSGSAFAYDGLIQQAAAQFGVDPALIKGVIQSESSFRSDAVSSAGAKGLMQLMDGTAQGLGVTDPFDPAQNINGGTRYLSYLLRKYDGNEAVALAAYNAGPGTIDKLGIHNDKELVARLQELPKETQAYVRKVLDARAAWTSL